MTIPPMDIQAALDSRSRSGSATKGDTIFGAMNGAADPSMSIIAGAAIIGLAIILARGL